MRRGMPDPLDRYLYSPELTRGIGVKEDEGDFDTVPMDRKGAAGQSAAGTYAAPRALPVSNEPFFSLSREFWSFAA